MKGDFSRQTFKRTKHYSGVLMQQGRVQLDADWNEQQAIARHRVGTESADVVGPAGAPRTSPGFQITPQERDLRFNREFPNRVQEQRPTVSPQTCPPVVVVRQ